MNIQYKINTSITSDEFIGLLKDSTLGARRPIDDYECIKGMLSNSNLIVSAWQGNKLIGIARSLTDFHYACYLSDLAVSKSFQSQGVGKRLLAITQEQLGPKCKLILIAAPLANDYYVHIGFEKNERCWILERDKTIVSRKKP